MEGWKVWSRTQGTWSYGNWHYIVPPGWQAYRTKSLEEICAFQWVSANATALRDLSIHCKGQYMTLQHEALLAEPSKHYREILKFCELPESRHFDSLLERISERVFTTRGSRPQTDKWKRLHRNEIESVRPFFKPFAESLLY